MESMIRELGGLLGEFEKLLQGLQRTGGECIGESAQQVADGVQRARARLGDIEQRLERQLRRTAHDAEEYVRDHPWRVIGACAAAGFLLGMLVSRRD